MSSKMATSTPKPKAHFKIVFSPGTDLTSLKGLKLGTKGRGRLNDLEAAINSIAYDNNGFGSSGTSIVKDPKKGTPADGQKLDKIVFLPKHVQKKVTVIRDTPKKIITPEGVTGQMRKQIFATPRNSSFSPVKKIVAGPSGQLGIKKRRLGDLAMAAWSAPKKIEAPVPVAETVPESPTMLCRICGTLIEDTAAELVDSSGELTETGIKLKAIVGTDINDSPLYPPACCRGCSFKVNVCFTLLIELQASDEVVRCTYSDLQEGDLVNPSNHIYTCQDCEQEVVGMKDFVRHYECHMQNKTLGKNPEEKITNAEEEDELDDPMLSAQVLLEEITDDGSVVFQNDLGEYVCEVCGKTFKYMFLLQLHRKAPKRGVPELPPVATPAPSKLCFVCKQPRASTLPCKLGDSSILLCQPCRANVSFMVI